MNIEFGQGVLADSTMLRLRVESGAAMYGPHRCPQCVDANYYGRYVHRGEADPPTCPNHGDDVVFLVPGAGARVDEGPEGMSRMACMLQPVPGYRNTAQGWCQGHEAV